MSSKMQIVYEYPPNYAAISKVFDIKDKPGIVFTYGYKLYVPGGKGVEVDKHLLIHEETHAAQQAAMGVEKWWELYLSEPQFRLVNEVEAYRNQYRSMGTLSLSQRKGYLDHIVKDLSGAMYGNVVSPEDAYRLVTDGIKLQGRGTPGKSSLDVRKLKKRQRQNRKKGRR